MSDELVKRLRAARVENFVHATGAPSYSIGLKQDPLCAEAAREIERLRERIGKAEHWAKCAMLMRSSQNIELLGILRGDEKATEQGK